jgi:hypothetical protein
VTAGEATASADETVDVAASLLERAQAAYKAKKAAPTNDIPVLADPQTSETLMYLRLGIPKDAQLSLARQAIMGQGSGAPDVDDHARFLGACVHALGVPGSTGKVESLKTPAGGEVSWVPYVAQITGIPVASPAQAIVALFTIPGQDGGPPIIDTQRLAEVSDMHRVAALADAGTAADEVTDPKG